MKEKQQFDIGTYFTIQYYAKKHDKTITRRGKWTEDCLVTNSVLNSPSFKSYGNLSFLLLYVICFIIVILLNLISDVKKKLGAR